MISKIVWAVDMYLYSRMGLDVDVDTDVDADVWDGMALELEQGKIDGRTFEKFGAIRMGGVEDEDIVMQ